MLKKKLPTPGLTKKPLSRPPSGGLKKKAPIVDDDNGDEEAEVDEEEADTEEEAAPVSKRKPLGGKVAKKVSNLADVFDSVPMSNNATDVPTGKYEAIIRDVVLQEPDAKGQSARMHFELCDPDFAEANSVTTWFKILDANGEPVRGGVIALKTTLAKLGYEPAGDEIEECFEEITGDNPGVILSISYTPDSNHYQRVKVDSAADNEVIQAYKDNVAY